MCVCVTHTTRTISLFILWLKDKCGSSRQEIPFDSVISRAEPKHFGPLTTLRNIPTSDP